jgi:DNA-binding LacI/PurR family transcriptional regulator
MSAGIDRLDGFRSALGMRFDPDLVEEGDFTTPSGVQEVDRLLARRPDIDGLFVASDLMSVGAIRSLSAAGRRIPEDMAVVGFDDAEVAATSSPPLTTVRQRTSDQGRLMAQILLELLGREVTDPMPELAREPEAGRLVLDVELVVRDTA